MRINKATASLLQSVDPCSAHPLCYTTEIEQIFVSGEYGSEMGLLKKISRFLDDFPVAKSIIKGYLEYVPPLRKKMRSGGTGGIISSRKYYSIWMRHLLMAHSNNWHIKPRTLVEIGPGDSLGVGLAAMLSGIERYYAVDTVKFADTERDMVIFEELIDLFSKKANIPDESEFPEIKPYLEAYEFPGHILTDAVLDDLLRPERLEKIREALSDPNSPIKGDIGMCYIAPWEYTDIIEDESIDMIISQAVLEHVDELDRAYSLMNRWLKKGGLMSHTIDFRSHGFAKEWNGHWAYSDLTWKLITGGRPYSINRKPHSAHVELIKKGGFEIVCDIARRDHSGIRRNDLHPSFSRLSDEDLTTIGTFIQAVKR